jgi:putative membrane protein
MSLEPLPTAGLCLLAAGYAWRARRLGSRVPRARVASFALGVALLAVALLVLDERPLPSHMTQHLLLLDLAPLALLWGLTGPLLRPVLALRPVRALRALAHPAVALPLWLVTLAAWHVPVAFDAALRHPWLHDAEHLSFVAAGLAIWAPVVETLPAPEWFGTGPRLAYVLAVRAAGTVLGTVLIFAGTVFYAGEGSLTDQRVAGAIMLGEGSILTVAVFAWLFLRLARESEQRELLLEQGVAPGAADRAVRYRRGPGGAASPSP